MLRELLHEMMSCQQCSFANASYPPLAPTRLSDKAKVMFIGENPSWEFGQRIPFDGITHSGRALHDNYVVPIKKAFNLKESDFWITDLFKCRYPKDVYRERAKRQAEVFSNAKTCATSWLLKEVELVQPEVIVTLGDKEVYQRMRDVFLLSCPSTFADAAYNPRRVRIGIHECSLLAACHPDISFNNSRKPGPSRKWSKLHQQNFIRALKGLLTRGGT